MREIWDKPDFEFNPHITLYDGDSRDFALKLIRVLDRHRLFFSFAATDVSTLKSTKGQHSLDLLLDLDTELASRIAGRPINRESVWSMDEDERLAVADTATQYLTRYAVTDQDVRVRKRQ